MAAAEGRASELEQEKVRAAGELSRTNTELADAPQRLADSQQSHLSTATQLYAEIADAERESHALALELAKARALLDSKFRGLENGS